MKFLLTTLSNNIKTVIVPVNNKQVVSINYKIKCGFYNEYKGINNYTHLLEHLIATFLNSEQCSMDFLQKHIGTKVLKTNAYTTDNEICFWIVCYYRDIEFFIDLLSRSLFDLCITQKNLDMSKKNVIKELQQSEDEYFSNDINTFLFKRKKVSFEYGIQDVNNATCESVERFYKLIFAKDIIIGVTCDKRYVKSINNLLKTKFDVKFEKPEKDMLPINFTLHYPKKTKIYRHYKPIKSVEINIVIPIDIDKRTIQYYNLMIGLDYLFSFDHGEMYKVLRHEMKLIYGISYEIITDDIDSKKSYVNVHLMCQPPDLQIVLTIFNNIFSKFTISKEMFKMTKNKLYFSTLYNYMNDYDDFQNYYVDCIFFSKPIINIPDRIKNVKYKDTCTMISKLKKLNRLVFLYNQKYKKAKI